MQIKERWLAVELQVVFTFKNVIEDTHSPSDASLGISEWLPGKAETGSEIVLVGKVGAFRNSRIAGKDQPTGALGKTVDRWPGTMEKERPAVSTLGVLYS